MRGQGVALHCTPQALPRVPAVLDFPRARGPETESRGEALLLGSGGRFKWWLREWLGTVRGVFLYATICRLAGG